jgi:hypothetical protein
MEKKPNKIATVIKEVGDVVNHEGVGYFLSLFAFPVASLICYEFGFREGRDFKAFMDFMGN